jgi:hypothetical protein
MENHRQYRLHSLPVNYTVGQTCYHSETHFNIILAFTTGIPSELSDCLNGSELVSIRFHTNSTCPALYNDSDLITLTKIVGMEQHTRLVINEFSSF